MALSTISRAAATVVLVAVVVLGVTGPVVAGAGQAELDASLTAQTVGDGPGPWPATGTASSETIEMGQELRLTPRQPGEISVTTRFSIPESVVSLETGVPAAATVTATNGFNRVSATEYRWNGRNHEPSLTYRLPANRTMEATGPIAGRGDYLFVDPGPWALVEVPRTATSWSWRGADTVRLSRQTTVDGPGAVGGAIAFLGEHRTVTRTAHGQTLRLVVPAAATLAEPPERILDSLAAASDTLRVGDRDEVVFVVAAPTGRVEWAVRGFQTGDADTWVRDRERLDTADNVWLHEYVHTRQGYVAEPGAQWFTEASASYYAALLTLEQGRIDFETFRARLALGTAPPDRNAVLADPATWDTIAPYTKGALVAGELDRQLRLATDRRRSLQDVFARMNAHEGTVSGERLRELVLDRGGEEVGALADRYITTREVPATWDAAAHGEAFATVPARVSYALAEGPGSVRVSGPSRDAAVDPEGPIDLVPGETLSVDVAVSNTGGATGEYDAQLRVDGSTVARETGTLGAGEVHTVTLEHRFESVGEHTVTAAGRELTVSVREAASPTVTDLTAVRTGTGPDGRVGVVLTATVRNDAPIPAAGDVTLVRDGAAVETRGVELGPGASVTVEFSEIRLEPGVHTFQVGPASARVTVEAPTTTEPDRLRVEGDGFGVVPAVVAVLVVVALLRRR